jgi:hypothetical protein
LKEMKGEGFSATASVTEGHPERPQGNIIYRERSRAQEKLSHVRKQSCNSFTHHLLQVYFKYHVSVTHVSLNEATFINMHSLSKIQTS